MIMQIMDMIEIMMVDEDDGDYDNEYDMILMMVAIMIVIVKKCTLSTP